jgi:hypothetical protein
MAPVFLVKLPLAPPVRLTTTGPSPVFTVIGGKEVIVTVVRDSSKNRPTPIGTLNGPFALLLEVVSVAVPLSVVPRPMSRRIWNSMA